VAMDLGVVSCLLLKVRVRFGELACFLPERAEMVFHRM